MPQSKSKRTARVARFGGLPVHPGLSSPDPLLETRLSDAPTEALRLPDQYSRPTAATVLKSEYTLNADAAGELFFGESYSLTASKLTSTVTAGTLGGIVTTAHPQATSFNAEAKVARMVMMRISLMYIGRADAASGYLSYDEKTETAIGATTMGDNHASSSVQVDAQDGLTVNLTYSQEPRWEAPTSTAFMANTFPVATFFASGLPVSTPVYRVRVWRYLEYLPFDGAISEGAMKAEPYNPVAMAVHSLLAGVATSVSKSGVLPAALRSAANAALHMAAPIGKWVVGEARTVLQGVMGASLSATKLLL